MAPSQLRAWARHSLCALCAWTVRCVLLRPARLRVGLAAAWAEAHHRPLLGLELGLELRSASSAALAVVLLLLLLL